MEYNEDRNCYVPKIHTFEEFDKWMKDCIVPACIARQKAGSGKYVWIGTPANGRKEMVRVIRRWLKHNHINNNIENVLKVVEREDYEEHTIEDYDGPCTD